MLKAHTYTHKGREKRGGNWNRKIGKTRNMLNYKTKWCNWTLCIEASFPCVFQVVRPGSCLESSKATKSIDRGGCSWPRFHIHDKETQRPIHQSQAMLLGVRCSCLVTILITHLQQFNNFGFDHSLKRESWFWSCCSLHFENMRSHGDVHTSKAINVGLRNVKRCAWLIWCYHWANHQNTLLQSTTKHDQQHKPNIAHSQQIQHESN